MSGAIVPEFTKAMYMAEPDGPIIDRKVILVKGESV
jgi:hypothetical protein